MIEKFRLPEPPQGLRSRILAVAANPAPSWARKRSAWRLLSIGSAIAGFVVIASWIVLPLRRSAAPGESVAGARIWLPPFEVMRRSNETPIAYSRRVFRTSGRKAGLLTYTWDSGPKTILSMEGAVPWSSELSFAGADPSEPLFEGETVSFLVRRGKAKHFLPVDLARMQASLPVSIPGAPDGKWAYTQCLALGKERFALVRVPEGQVMFSRSLDEGATWSRMEEIARTRPGDYGGTARLLIAGTVLHLFYVPASGAVRHLQSDDRGVRWREGGTSPTGALEVFPHLGGLVLDGSLHLVVCLRGAWSHHVSRDGGRTWTRHSIGTDDNEHRGFTLTGRGSTLCLALEGVRTLFLSQDAGATWKRENAFERIRGEIRCASAWIEADGRILAEAEARMSPEIDFSKIPQGPGFQATGAYGVGYIVLRSYDEAPTLPPPDPKEVQVLIGQLADDEVARRNEAERKLLGLGDAIVPALRNALGRTRDAEVQSRLGSILKTRECRWPGTGPVPVWWNDGPRK